MEKTQILYRIKPPCSKCPYKLGLVGMVKNPCPECEMDGYKVFDRFCAMAKGMEYAKDEVHGGAEFE